MSTAVASPQASAPRALRGFAWGVLLYFVATILWGAVVRATNSGDGCGNHWPLCNGTVLQQSPTLQTIIEFTHRITAALDVFFVFGLIVWTTRVTKKGHLARTAAWLSLFFTFTEGLLGALLVKLGLTGQSQSPLRAPFLALHFANTLLLVAVLTLAAHFLSRDAYKSHLRVIAPIGAVIGTLAVLAVGVSGSMAALGDTLFPSTTLAAAFSQDMSTSAAWLVRWRWMHPAMAIIASIFIAWLVIRGRKDAVNRALAMGVVALLAVQYLLGVLDVTLLAPVWMQVLHLLGADFLWIAVIILTARITLVNRAA